MPPPFTVRCFRMVRLSEELQNEFSQPLRICADPDGLPFLEGQLFRAWLIDDNACQPATADKYLKTILPFFTFLWFGRPPLRYTAPAIEIRSRIRDYLKEKLGCAVRPHRQGNYTVSTLKPTSNQSVRLWLVALRRFYECAILKGWYADVNPLLWVKRLVPSEHTWIPSMPPASGLTFPDKRRGRVPDTFFCFLSGDWRPQILEDPALPHQLIPAFTRRRDQLIARILFQSGARISEVLALTMGDWRRLALRNRALATNKGSHGDRVKEVWWSGETTQLLRHYVETDRRQCDRLGRGLDNLPDDAQLFVTDDGDPLTYFAFYYHWRKACAKAGLRLHPHQARHWFVTMALRRIQALPDPLKREAHRQALITYVKWKSPETIRAYDHHLQLTEFASTHEALVLLVEGKPLPSERAAEVDRPTERQGGIPRETWSRLNQILDATEEAR